MMQTAPEQPTAPRSPGESRFSFTTSVRSEAARGAAIYAMFTVGLGVLSLLKGFILAGFVSRSAYGIWGVLVVSLSTLLWLKQAGIGDKFVQQDESDQERAFQLAFTLELILTGAGVVVVAIALPVLVLIYNLPQLVLPGVVIMAALMISVFQAPLWVYYRRMEFRRQRMLAAVDPIVEFVVSIGLAIAGAGYWSFVGGLAAGVTAASLVAVLRSPFKIRLRYEPGALRSYWSFSAPLLVAGGAGFVMAWSAIITAKLSLGIAAVGAIALADNIAAMSERVDDVVTGALYPAICAVTDRLALLYESLVKSNRLALMWAVPFGIGITLFCGDLVHFGIGERWRPAVTLLQLYGVTAALNHIGFNWTAYFRAINRTRPIAVVSVAATVAFLVAGIPLLLAFGLRGFALGIVIQALAALAFRAYYLQQLFPGFGFFAHAARSFLPTVPATATVLLARAVESGHRTVVEALCELAAFVVVTIAGTWLLESSLLHEAAAYLRPKPAAVQAG